jgi:hypothetical protein
VPGDYSCLGVLGQFVLPLLETCLLRKGSGGFSRKMFKLSAIFIQFIFSEYSAF